MESVEFFREVKKILSYLSDEESKIIYKSMMRFRLLGEMDSFEKSTNYVLKKRGVENFFEDLKCGKYEEIVIFGAGTGARVILELFDSIGIKVAYCVDNNPTKWGKQIRGVLIKKPQEILEDSARKIVIISSPSPKFSAEIKEQIQEMGIRDELFHIPSAMGTIYYDEELFKNINDIVMVDGGCYDGANVIALNELFDCGIRKVYAFEPDVQNLEQCRKNLQCIDNVELIHGGLYGYTGVVKFKSNCGGASSIADEGDCEINVIKIDDVATDANFIKMDIEGAELEALKGAETTIKSNKPILAISIYHKAQDLIDIPLYIKSLVPEYKFYVRQYTMTYADCVLFAICDEEKR